MSVLANKTDHKVLKVIAESLKQLDKIDELNLKVTKTDDFEISLAKNMLKSVIDNNDITVNIDRQTE